MEDEVRYLDLIGPHSWIVGFLAVVLWIMGAVTLFFAVSGLPGFDNEVDMLVLRPFLYGGGFLYVVYGTFGIVAAARRKVPTSGCVGLMFFGRSASRREPKNVSLHFIGILLIASAFAWLLPVCEWLGWLG